MSTAEVITADQAREGNTIRMTFADGATLQGVVRRMGKELAVGPRYAAELLNHLTDDVEKVERIATAPPERLDRTVTLGGQRWTLVPTDLLDGLRTGAIPSWEFLLLLDEDKT